jgi:hypothetical protein
MDLIVKGKFWQLFGTIQLCSDVPEPPSEVHLTCQPKSALISWRSASEHGSPVNEYRIELKNNFQLDDEWQQVLLEEAGDKKEYEAQLSLSPWVNYTFRVVALNSYGESKPAEVNEDGEGKCLWGFVRVCGRDFWDVWEVLIWSLGVNVLIWSLEIRTRLGV